MNMDLETLATLDAAGALSPEERREFERALAAAPVETRQAIAEIREQAALRELPVACYANNYVGYVVPAAAFEQGGYEAGVCWLGVEAEGLIKAQAVSLLREVTG